MYTPEFQTGLSILFGGKPIVPINPVYCLTMQSAVQLAQLPQVFPIVSKIGVGDPLGITAPGSPFSVSEMVPFLVFIGGAAINAASLAEYFEHNMSEENAIAGVVNCIVTTMQGFVANPASNPLVLNAQAVPPPPPPPTPPPVFSLPPQSPVGAPVGDGSNRYQNLMTVQGTNYPIGGVTGQGGVPADPRGTFTLAGLPSPFSSTGFVTWWVKS